MACLTQKMFVRFKLVILSHELKSQSLMFNSIYLFTLQFPIQIEYIILAKIDLYTNIYVRVIEI